MPPLVVDVLRSRDLLHVQLEFVNLVPGAGGAAGRSLRRAASGPAFIVLRLPPQHIAEEAFPVDAPRRRPSQAFLSCPSTIAFRVPDATAEVPFSLEALLRLLTELEPLTLDAPAADGVATVIEFPAGLLLVPEPSARLRHLATGVATRRTPLWQTHLVTNGVEGAPGPRFRARPNLLDRERFAPPAVTALAKRHRDDIRARSAGDAARPDVIESSRFVLSALGASAGLRSNWPANGETTLVAWDHEAELGRDRRVRTVSHGWLLPFGHRASVVTLTQRSLAGPVAELVQRRTLAVQEGERRYEGRDMPFKMIRITGVRGDGELAGPHGPVRADVIAEDASGNLVAAELTMLFVESGAADARTLEELRRTYEDEGFGTVSLGNQRVALADDPDGRGDTALNVAQLTFGVRLRGDLASSADAPFAPFLDNAEVTIPAIAHLLGSTGAGVAGGVQKITLAERYLREGFRPGDAAGVFATLVRPVPLSIPTERAGGLATPKFPPMDGLSRSMGPVAGARELAAGVGVSPRGLVDLESKLLGVLSLKDIVADSLEDVDAFPAAALDGLYAAIDDPRTFLSRPVLTTVLTSTQAETRFLWKPRLKQDVTVPQLKARPGMALIVKGRVSKVLLGSGSHAPESETEGKLVHFALTFGDFLTVAFDEVAFTNGSGRKMAASVKVAAVTFESKLRFVEKIGELLRLGGRGGLRIEPLTDGIRVGYALPLPSAPLGVFSIQNVALSLGVSLPFVDGRPTAVRFALSERSHPFLVTVSIFGGTGFFALEVRTDGSVKLEAAIEFGGITALDFIVARATVYLLAGIYVSVESGEVLVSGYLRLGGQVDVLGLASASIEFYLALEYVGSRNVLAGVGRVTVSVKLLFFSKSFSFEVRKEISFDDGPGERIGDVPVADLPVAGLAAAGRRLAAPRARAGLSALQWRQYCAAFA